MPGISTTDATTLAAYAGNALRSMRQVLDRAHDDELDVRPHADGTNSIATLVVHSVAVSEFWIGHIALGRESTRDREAEFTASASRPELEQMLDTTRTQIELDIHALVNEAETRPNELRGFLAGDEGDHSLIVHVLEELFQHLGHMEITADALVAGRA